MAILPGRPRVGSTPSRKLSNLSDGEVLLSDSDLLTPPGDSHDGSHVPYQSRYDIRLPEADSRRQGLGAVKPS
jgi:hypothetical protein